MVFLISIVIAVVAFFIWRGLRGKTAADNPGYQIKRQKKLSLKENFV